MTASFSMRPTRSHLGFATAFACDGLSAMSFAAATSGTPGIDAINAPADKLDLSTSIAIGTDGLPVISYLDSTAGALMVATCANAACTGTATITTVDGPIFANGFESP